MLQLWLVSMRRTLSDHTLNKCQQQVVKHVLIILGMCVNLRHIIALVAV